LRDRITGCDRRFECIAGDEHEVRARAEQKDY
jgi:hypothetical protein